MTKTRGQSLSLDEPIVRRKKKSKKVDFINEILPHLKQDEIDLLLSINSDDDLKQMAKDFGIDDKRIKEIFKK